MNSVKKNINEHIRKIYSSGTTKELEEILKSENILHDEKKRKSLVQFISNSYSFFSYTINLNNSENDMLERKKLILQHLSLSEQLHCIFREMKKEFSTHLYQSLSYDKKNKKDREILKNDINLFFLITDLFHYEKFEEIEKISIYFNIDLLRLSNNICILMRDDNEKGMKISSTIKNKDISYYVYNDIIYNYSYTKEEFLLKHNISIPTRLEALSLTESHLEYYQKNSPRMAIDLALIENQNEYLKHLLYYELKEKIEHKHTRKYNMGKKI